MVHVPYVVSELLLLPYGACIAAEAACMAAGAAYMRVTCSSRRVSQEEKEKQRV